MDTSVHRYGIQCTSFLTGLSDTTYLVTLYLVVLGPYKRFQGTEKVVFGVREDPPFYMHFQPMFCHPLKFLFGWKKNWLLDLDI